MTLRLILTRHAKSDWSNPMLDDRERPLNKRGRHAASAIGRWLAGAGYRPDLALVSTALRTRQTWKRIAPALTPLPAVQTLDSLYHAEPAALLEVLRDAASAPLMIIAHNPGIAFFARALLDAPPADALFERFPTAATAVIDFAVADWAEASWGSGRLQDFVVPRQLTGH